MREGSRVSLVGSRPIVYCRRAKHCFQLTKVVMPGPLRKGFLPSISRWRVSRAVQLWQSGSWASSLSASRM